MAEVLGWKEVIWQDLSLLQFSIVRLTPMSPPRCSEIPRQCNPTPQKLDHINYHNDWYAGLKQHISYYDNRYARLQQHINYHKIGMPGSA